MNKENLLKLADFLEKLPETEHFGMEYYTLEPSISPSSIVHSCGTASCAVGWSPIALGLSYKDTQGLGWSRLSRKYLINRCSHEHEWGWCFSSWWYEIDNTAKGAAARIKALLDKGLPEIGKYCDMESILEVSVDSGSDREYLLDWYKDYL